MKLSVHDHVHHHQTTKCSANEIKLFHLIVYALLEFKSLL